MFDIPSKYRLQFEHEHESGILQVRCSPPPICQICSLSELTTNVRSSRALHEWVGEESFPCRHWALVDIVCCYQHGESGDYYRRRSAFRCREVCVVIDRVLLVIDGLTFFVGGFASSCVVLVSL